MHFEESELMVLLLTTACCWHELHTGFGWGMQQFTTPERHKYVFLAIESLKNAIELKEGDEKRVKGVRIMTAIKRMQE